jgi:hypothetical protein
MDIQMPACHPEGGQPVSEIKFSLVLGEEELFEYGIVTE